MAARVSSLIMPRGSRPAASPSSPARLNLISDPGRSRHALPVRPQEEHVRRAPLLSAGRLGPGGLDLARTPLGSRNGFRVVSSVKHLAGIALRSSSRPAAAIALLSFLPIAGDSPDRLIDAVDGSV